MELKIEYMALEKLKPYEKNARKHQEADLSTIKASITEFGMSDPIGVWGKDNIIVEGHGRYLACKELGIEKVPVIHLDHLTDEQRRAYALAHNKTAEMSEWDIDLLGEELDGILDIDMSDFGFLDEDEEETIGKYDDARNDKNLQERFGVPPFSILDSRQGYWKDRKNEWKSLGIHSEVGRDDTLIGEGLLKLAQNSHRENMIGTSIFDPVLCEIAYKWYCTEGGVHI